MAVTADDPGQPAMHKSNLLFSSQLSDSAEEEDSADLKKAQKGELREVPGHLWGRREVGHLSPQPLTLRAYGGSPGSGLWCASGFKSNSKNSEESPPLCAFLALNPWHSPLALILLLFRTLTTDGGGDQGHWVPCP